MDPLSIASTALGLSATCFQVAKAIKQYVDEVRDVGNTVSLFGQDMNTLSKALDNVHGALKKHEPSLSANLGDEVNLFDSLGACIQDCDSTVNHIMDLLTDSQSHGRFGNTMPRVATQWKINGKEKELTLLRSRVISFHTAMNMNLQMIQVCLFLQVQGDNEARQNDVLDGITQLRREINKIRRLEQRRRTGDSHSVPATVLRSLNVAMTLDESASTTFDDILSVTTQEPSDRVNRWMQTSHNWEAPPSNTVILETPLEREDSLPGMRISESREHPRAESTTSSTSTSNHLAGDSTQSSTAEENLINDMQRSRTLLQRGNIEQAKSLCRKVLHATESEISISSLIYKDALETLASSYEYTGDNRSAMKLRLLLDTSGRNTIRQQFKNTIQTKKIHACIGYVSDWAILLHDNVTYQLYRDKISGLWTWDDDAVLEEILLCAVSIMGNALLAEFLLAQGISIHTEAPRNNTWAWGCKTPLGYAILFRHRHLVETLLEVGSNDFGAIMKTQCLETAFKNEDVETLRMLFEHLCLLQRRTHGIQMPFQATEPERLQIGALISSWFGHSDLDTDGKSYISKVLGDAVKQKNLALIELLLSYGIRSTHTIKCATELHWLDGIKFLIPGRNHLTEPMVSYALRKDLIICRHMLTLDPTFVTGLMTDVLNDDYTTGLKVLVSFGVDVNAPFKPRDMGFKIDPLRYAVLQRRPAMVSILLEAGADVHTKSVDGRTVLDVAIHMAIKSKIWTRHIQEIIFDLKKAGSTYQERLWMDWPISSKRRQIVGMLRAV